MLRKISFNIAIFPILNKYLYRALSQDKNICESQENVNLHNTNIMYLSHGISVKSKISKAGKIIVTSDRKMGIVTAVAVENTDTRVNQILENRERRNVPHSLMPHRLHHYAPELPDHRGSNVS